MPSLQRIALFVFFDSIENDLVMRLREIAAFDPDILTSEERANALLRLERREDLDCSTNEEQVFHGLNLGEKYDVLLRHASRLTQTVRSYYKSNKRYFDEIIPVRNSVMHGRPLTVVEHSKAFAFANDLMKAPGYWPELKKAFSEYNKDPESITKRSLAQFLDEEDYSTFHNLPVPDYDDTGFIPRDKLQSDLLRKILGRHPVITVLGDGGDGKTAVTLQTLYDLIARNDHPFDGVVWVSAKSNRLGLNEIERIENAICSSLDMFGAVAEVFEARSCQPLERVRQLLQDNSILLVIDNLETIIDSDIRNFAESVPGQSKVLFTSRVPLGSDLTVFVGPFSPQEGLRFLRALISAYSIRALRDCSNEKLTSYASRLHNKPLLLKWFALGVAAGLNPDRIVADPKKALQFCLENVIDSLSASTKEVVGILSILPRPTSIAVLAHISRLRDEEVEGAVAELLRYGLIEPQDSQPAEKNFRLRTFARSYVARETRLTPKDGADILSRFRSIDFTFESERGGATTNRFNIKNFSVQSRSDAVAVQRLRSAIKAARDKDFSEAESIISNLKITNPDYFEVFRVEAFVASEQSDLSRAQGAFETATEIAPQEAQLRLFYAGFLLRRYNDPAAALEQLRTALELSPEEVPLLFEAARAAMYLFDYDSAEKYIDAARVGGFASSKLRQIGLDLHCQLFERRLSYILDKLRPADSERHLLRLLVFLQQLDFSMLDFRNIGTLRKLQNVL